MSVTREEVDAICSALPGGRSGAPPELISWKVGGKMFACLGKQDDTGRRFGQDPGR
jgi:predicted DNA-binding protein (MmcQ/YjbR family)